MAWCTIESDPGVFTELLDEFGAKGLQLDELYALDQALSGELGKVYGLFFLFKWEKSKGRGSGIGSAAASDAADEPIFVPQTVHNACGTIALLHVLLNRDDIALGPTLTEFKSLAAALPVDLRGDMLSANDAIRVAHNKFARPEPFEMDDRPRDDDDDEAFHFIAYTGVGDKLYEFDGLKPAPVLLAHLSTGEDWLTRVAPEIEARMAEYSATGEIRFNLLAMVEDKAAAACRDAMPALAKLAVLRGADGAASVAALAEGVGASPGDVEAAVAALPAGEVAMLTGLGDADRAAAAADAEAIASRCAAVVASERERRAQWRKENERRRHNFVPFIMTLLDELAARDKLMPLYEAGKKRVADQRAAMIRERVEAKKAQQAAAAAAAAGTGGSGASSGKA